MVIRKLWGTPRRRGGPENENKARRRNRGKYHGLIGGNGYGRDPQEGAPCQLRASHGLHRSGRRKGRMRKLKRPGKGGGPSSGAFIYPQLLIKHFGRAADQQYRPRGIMFPSRRALGPPDGSRYTSQTSGSSFELTIRLV